MIPLPMGIWPEKKFHFKNRLAGSWQVVFFSSAFHVIQFVW
jgi:hypothetical protein